MMIIIFEQQKQEGTAWFRQLDNEKLHN